MNIFQLISIIAITYFQSMPTVLAVQLNAKTYKPCIVPAVFTEQFTEKDLESWSHRWFLPSDSAIGSFKLVEAPNRLLANEYGLITTAPGKRHVVFSDIDVPITRESSSIPITLSFQIKPTAHWDCGHANIKLLSQKDSTNEDNEATFPLIEFGVKKCGLYDYAYFSFGSYENQFVYHLKNPPRSGLTDYVTNMYTLILKNDKFTIRRNKQVLAHGNVQDAFSKSPVKHSSFQQRISHAEEATLKIPCYSPTNVFLLLLLRNASYAFTSTRIELDAWSELPGIFMNNIYFGFSESDASLFENEMFDIKNLLESNQNINRFGSDGRIKVLLKLIIISLKTLWLSVFDATYGNLYNYFYDTWITEGLCLPKETFQSLHHAVLVLSVVISPVIYWMLKS
ncbi:calreticulin/calnexin [Schizosaccharomyces octosporus yFS286]|uniref:Calreticulin/calnexin n=1 Tax=Schizosaccharomyces octosporus (strain yFS286) TaxID=483514 RepID=S9QXI7_SCHOY|nr:calreticulin/calnexin [Schizosaccharomyces octosporus yFS286]EPX71005.1 calreticulin/calnexin [Schizosaccharomyces octosporus yFS286]